MLYHAGKRSREEATFGKQCYSADWEKSAMLLPGPKVVPITGKACPLAFRRPPELSVPFAGIKSQLTAQSKNKLASGEKNNKKNAKGKSPSAQKRKEPANKLDKKVNTICPG